MEDKIIQYLTGEASKSTSKSVLEWRDKNPEEFKKWEEAYRSPLFEEVEFKRVSKIKLGRTSSLRTQFSIAAAILLLIAIAWMLVPKPRCPQEIEMVEVVNSSLNNQEVSLPDGSVLILNPQTSIRYQKEFNREIELAGTALLKIHKDRAHPFIVYSDFSTIRVLGTEFMVQNLKNKQNIILKEGKVEVSTKKEGQKKYLSNNGEMITVNRDDELSSVKTINCNLYFSWQEEKLSFQQASVKEVVEYLEDCYSIDVEILDKMDWQTKLIGSAPKGKPELIIQAIARIIDKKIEKKNNKYILK